MKRGNAHMPVTIVVAVSENGVIGKAGKIPWNLPAEQAHFRALTIGHVLVMGRRTFDSIGRPLPGRTTVVVTRRPDWSAPGVEVSHSVDEALDRALEIDANVFVVGGSAIYAEALPRVSDIVLSEITGEYDGDTYLPSFDRSEWREVERRKGHGFDIIRLQRVTDGDANSTQSRTLEN
jgi:dihydrofolate reductase